MWCERKESCACLFHSLRLWCFHISLQHIFAAFSRNVQKYHDLFSVRSRERLKSRVPESTSQLLLNREETNAKGGPKWRQIGTSYKIHKKFAFYANRKIFSLKFLGWCLDSDKQIKKNSDMGTLKESFFHKINCSTTRAKNFFFIPLVHWTSNVQILVVRKLNLLVRKNY